MATPEQYPWMRLETETPQAYDAFRTYLRLEGERSVRKCAEAVGKDKTIIGTWSKRHDWIERARAWDSYVTTAGTDGIVDAMTESRTKNLQLVDKLRDHLSSRLDHFIETKTDPTVRWTQALAAMAKVEQNAFLLKENAKERAELDRAMALVERLEEALARDPE